MSGRIAAIVTCRDLGQMLLDAVDSVEKQTRPAAEIVVVDDASVDVHTRQIVARLQRGGTRVAFGEGRGAAAARNLGARLTSSEYLVCLDGDDVLDPSYFAAAAARLDADPDLDFVSCAIQAFGGADYTWTPSAPTFVDAIASSAVPHASTMVRRSLWERIGGFDESLASFELLDFWASALERGARGVVLDAPLLRYRVRRSSGYRRTIRTGAYGSRMRHLYAKHRDAVEAHALELLAGKEAFLHGQREHRRHLDARVASLERELRDLQQHVADATAALEAHGAARVEWGDLGGVRPLSTRWGMDRGKAVDRHYIEAFLDAHRGDVRGRVLEVRDSTYTRRFGGEGVTACDVIDIDPTNGAATIVADLRRADAIERDTYDCIILTQTLYLIDDMAAVVAECERILRPGGVLLVTAPSVIRVDEESGVDGDFWRLTEASARALFSRAFPIEAFDVTSYGNVKTCAAFLYGLSSAELSAADLDHVDPMFPMVIAVRATKPVASHQSPVASHRHGRAVILCYHRIADLTPDSHALCTPPEIFRAHMRALRERFTPIALDDLISAAASGDIPDQVVAVTFDDGYLDALRTASPILAEFDIPATFFVNSDRLDQPHERWWDILERVYLGGGPSAERQEKLDELNRRAWAMDERGRAQLVADAVASSGIDETVRTSHRVLTANELRELAARPGHTIGAHTAHHLALTMHAADVKRREIVDDKAALEHVLGRRIDLFSYPYGDFDAETVALVTEAGYRAAMTVECGLVAAGGNRLLMPRYEITRRDHTTFADRVLELFDSQRTVPRTNGCASPLT